jgi:hypothetical protein
MSPKLSTTEQKISHDMGIAYPIEAGAEAQGILRGRFVAQADKKTGAEAPVKSTLICR